MVAKATCKKQGRSKDGLDVCSLFAKLTGADAPGLRHTEAESGCLGQLWTRLLAAIF